MDQFGPEHVVKVYDPKTGMRGLNATKQEHLRPAKAGGAALAPSVF